jgi:hypothetical protein
MSQNINLFNPALRKKREPLSLGTAVACLVIVVAGLFAYQLYQQHRVNALAEELRSAEVMLKERRALADKLKGQVAAAKPDAGLEAEIAKLEAELRQAREAEDALKGGVFGNREGFSEYLRAFSRQSVSGLWLTGFTIGGAGELEIRGRVLSPNLVPAYIQRLNRERILQGRSLARLEMSEPREEPRADREKAVKPAPRFLEFSLATTEAALSEKRP